MKYVPIGAATMANVNPSSLYMTDLWWRQSLFPSLAHCATGNVSRFHRRGDI
jgi:hypothetical protein